MPLILLDLLGLIALGAVATEAGAVALNQGSQATQNMSQTASNVSQTALNVTDIAAIAAIGYFAWRYMK